MNRIARTLITVAAFLLAQQFAAAATDGQAIALAGSEARVEFPRVASRRFVTAIGWVEKQASGLEWVRLVTFKDGVLPPQSKIFQMTRVVSAYEAGTNSDIALAIDPKTSQPGIAWIHARDGMSTLQFNGTGIQSGRTLEIITQSKDLLDPPVICFDEAGTAYAAWSEIAGGSSRLFVANRAAGGWKKRSVSADTRPYDVIPQLFIGPNGAEVYWYSIQSGNSAAFSASINGGLLGETQTLSLGAIPANRLPILYPVQPGNRTGAYWVEQRPEGEVYLNIDPRDGGEYAPMVVGGETNRTQQLSYSTEGTGTAAWIDSLESGEHYLTVASRERGEFSKPVSDEAREPTVTASDNWIHAIWIDPHSPDGNGSLWYWRVH